MALHPRAQVQLYKYLKEMAKRKNLTVLFSTHSVTLIKYVDHKNLIFLQRIDDSVEVIVGCFPAYALGNITFGEEKAPDRIIYVEDEAARAAVETLAQTFVKSKYANSQSLFPSYKIVPIGPFESVVKFLDQSGAMIASKAFALLDIDVKNESVKEWERTKNHKQLALFQKHSAKIKYLPWSSEVGLVEMFCSRRQEIEQLLKAILNNPNVVIAATDFPANTGLVSSEWRKRSKALFKAFISKISQQIAQNEEQIEQQLWNAFAVSFNKTNHGDVMALFGPMLG